MDARILLFEQNVSLSSALGSILRPEHYEVLVVHEPVTTLERLLNRRFDLLIADSTSAPAVLDVCRAVRERGLRLPILLLQDRPNVQDCIVALRHGADDCLPKPFDPRELLARVEALLRRARDPVTQQLTQIC